MCERPPTAEISRLRVVGPWALLTSFPFSLAVAGGALAAALSLVEFSRPPLCPVPGPGAVSLSATRETPRHEAVDGAGTTSIETSRAHDLTPPLAPFPQDRSQDGTSVTAITIDGPGQERTFEAPWHWTERPAFFEDPAVCGTDHPAPLVNEDRDHFERQYYYEEHRCSMESSWIAAKGLLLGEDDLLIAFRSSSGRYGGPSEVEWLGGAKLHLARGPSLGWRSAELPVNADAAPVLHRLEGALVQVCLRDGSIVIDADTLRPAGGLDPWPARLGLCRHLAATQEAAFLVLLFTAILAAWRVRRARTFLGSLLGAKQEDAVIAGADAEGLRLQTLAGADLVVPWRQLREAVRRRRSLELLVAPGSGLLPFPESAVSTVQEAHAEAAAGQRVRLVLLSRKEGKGPYRSGLVPPESWVWVLHEGVGARAVARRVWSGVCAGEWTWFALLLAAVALASSAVALLHSFHSGLPLP